MTSKPDAKVYAVGTERGRIVVWVLIDGRQFVIPTDAITMSRLAEAGLPIKNAA